MRELTSREVENLGYLQRFHIDFGLLEPTAVGLAKSILDATSDYRDFLARRGIHSFSSQQQGPENKRIVSAHILTAEDWVIPASASLYRPLTKKGDPRVWFTRLANYCKPGDILVSLWFKDSIWVLNATQTDFPEAVKFKPQHRAILAPLVSDRASIFEEILTMLRDLSSRGYIPTYKRGDTAVGHLLETELGIKANSRKAPDYCGVELKSSRARGTASQTMFAKVPAWELSELRSSREILNEFGYWRGDEFKLYCTVSSLRANSQGLRLSIDEKEGLLWEGAERRGLERAVAWRISELEEALAAKHADTFWIEADSVVDGGVEKIRFLTARQTTSPVLQQMTPMLKAGRITVDHLIKRKGNRVSEKGPLFKIAKSHFDELFPEPIFHDLRLIS